MKLELERKEAEIKQKEEYFANLEVLSEKLEGYSEELAKIDSAFLVEPPVPTLFDFIQKASSENGLVLESLTLAGISPLANVVGTKKISLSASVSGSYTALKNFLTTIYNTARLTEVESIGFSFPEERGLFTFDLALESYFYQEPEIKESGLESSE